MCSYIHSYPSLSDNLISVPQESLGIAKNLFQILIPTINIIAGWYADEGSITVTTKQNIC